MSNHNNIYCSWKQRLRILNPCLKVYHNSLTQSCPITINNSDRSGMSDKISHTLQWNRADFMHMMSHSMWNSGRIWLTIYEKSIPAFWLWAMATSEMEIFILICVRRKDRVLRLKMNKFLNKLSVIREVSVQSMELGSINLSTYPCRNQKRFSIFTNKSKIYSIPMELWTRTKLLLHDSVSRNISKIDH